MFKCIVIDDQPHAVETLEASIAAIPGLELVSAYTDPVVALMAIQESQQVDLILLDIDMPGLSGLELAKHLRARTRKLVFVSSYADYGYEAFKVDADEFLLKPFSIGEFAVVIEKVFRDMGNVTGTNLLRSYFFVKSKDEQNRIVKIDFTEVIAIESRMNYVIIHTFSKKVVTLITLGEIAKYFLSKNQFVRFQRSFIICLEHITAIDGMTIYMKGNVQLTVGDAYRKSFRAFLEEHIIAKSGSGATCRS